MAPTRRSYDSSGLNHPYDKSYKRSKTSGQSFTTPDTRMRDANKRRKTTQSYGKNSSYKSKSGPYRSMSSGSSHTNSSYPVPETKWQDFATDGTVATTATVPVSMPIAGNVEYMNQLASGFTSQTRIGASVATLNCTYRFEVALGATPVKTSGRVCLVWDKQPNAQPSVAWTDIFVQANYLSYMNISNSERFTILRNQQFSLSPAGDQELFFDGRVSINLQSQYITSGVNNVPVTGALLLAFISDQAVVANQPVLNGVWRLRFKDA